MKSLLFDARIRQGVLPGAAQRLNSACSRKQTVFPKLTPLVVLLKVFPPQTSRL